MVKPGELILGVDGGGTSCRAALLVGTERHEVALGPANVSTDFDRAVATIREAAHAVASVAGIAPEAVFAAPAHLGLAGVMSEAIAARVRAALPFSDAGVTDDRPTTIAGALGPDDGAVAAIGTGSFLGRQVAGQVRGIGGWGFQIGDQASGAWLMRRCLEEVMLSVDGIAAQTALTRRILADHGNDPAAIVRFSLAAKPADYARLARAVVTAAGTAAEAAAGTAAEAGDPLGRRLMGEGADYIRAGLAVLGWAPGEALCLTGGLGPAYATWLGVPTVPAKGSALDGALLLAARRRDRP